MRLNPKKFQLENGVKGLLVPMEGVESVASLVMVRTGSRNEEEKKAGVSHALEHMLFKGTEKYKTARDVAVAVDSLGAESNAFTGKEYTGYYIKSASNHIGKALEILGEMVGKARLRGEDWEREKGVIVEEINMYEDLPMERVKEEFENLLFSGSSLGRLIIGKKESVKGLGEKELRSYRDEWYRGENVLVVLAGKVEGEAEELVRREFGGLFSGEEKEYVSEGKYGEEKGVRIDKETEQAHFVLGVPGVSYGDERFFPLELSRIILGGNMSSRLFSEIREKRGWAYYVKALKARYMDAGHLAVWAGVKKDVLEEAVEVVRDELLSFAGDVEEEELSQAKEYFKGTFILNLEDPFSVARYVGRSYLQKGEIWEPEAVMEGMEEVDLKKISEVMGEMLREEKLRLAVVE